MSSSRMTVDALPWSLLQHYLRPHRMQMVGLWLLMLGMLVAQLINPQIIGRFLDAAEAGQPLNVLIGAAGLFIAIAIVEQLLGLAGAYVGSDVGWQATNRLREDVALHCLRLDLGFYKAHSPGEMIERIDGDINELGNFFSNLALNLINNLLLLVGVLILLWWQDWRIGVAVTVCALGGLLAVNVIRTAAVPHWRTVRQATGKLYGSLEEWLGGTQDIRPNGAQEYIKRQPVEHLQTLFEKSWMPRYFQMAGLAVPILTFGLAYIFVFILSDWLYAQQAMSIGTVYVTIYYLSLLSGPLWSIVNEVRDLQTAGASIERVQEIMQTPSAIIDQGQADLPDGPLAVRFDDVTFSYEPAASAATNLPITNSPIPNHQSVLDDITFDLAPGDVLGLLGRTGSGKTTLTRLLVRLIDPVSGVVSLGVDPASTLDIRDMPLSTLRRHVSMVTQDVQLLHGTLRDNLTFYEESVPDSQLLAVADELGLTEWIAQLPDGLDTEISSGGQGLSAGEAQLVAFMRVYLQDPGLIILDEASSRLDPVTERLLTRAMGRLFENRTGIIIAHRLATVQQTDKILVLEGGRIVEFGDRASLAADDEARYAELLRQDRGGKQS